jgi:hypothetical protein
VGTTAVVRLESTLALGHGTHSLFCRPRSTFQGGAPAPVRGEDAALRSPTAVHAVIVGVADGDGETRAVPTVRPSGSGRGSIGSVGQGPSFSDTQRRWPIYRLDLAVQNLTRITTLSFIHRGRGMVRTPVGPAHSWLADFPVQVRLLRHQLTTVEPTTCGQLFPPPNRKGVV